MRGLFTVLAAITIVGCLHRPSSPFRSVRQRFAAVIHSGAVKLDTNAAITAANQAPPPPAPGVEPPRAEPPRAEPPRATRDQPRPRPTTRPPAELPVQRTSAARSTVFVLRGQTKAGAGFCEQFATSDACTSACTAKLRPSMLAAPGPSSVTSCACLEQDSGC